MTIIQYGMAKLAKKVSNFKQLVQTLVIISGDAKKSDISEDIVKSFIAEAAKTTARLEDPKILLSLWMRFKRKGVLLNETDGTKNSGDTQ
jgi:chaperonin GroEL (HSP60 family)